MLMIKSFIILFRVCDVCHVIFDRNYLDLMVIVDGCVYLLCLKKQSRVINDMVIVYRARTFAK